MFLVWVNWNDITLQIFVLTHHRDKKSMFYDEKIHSLPMKTVEKVCADISLWSLWEFVNIFTTQPTNSCENFSSIMSSCIKKFHYISDFTTGRIIYFHTHYESTITQRQTTIECLCTNNQPLLLKCSLDLYRKLFLLYF